jgi:serine/threonine-protein kinase
MLATGFGPNPPPELRRMLDAVKSHVKEIGELRLRALDEEQKLEQLDHEAREGRLRFGRAMDALSVDASKIREEARTLRAAVTPLHEATVGFPPLLIAANKQIVIWEGRSGFAEPYGELVAAYRHAADLMERWHGLRASELVAQQAAVEKERAVADVDYQIKELRAGLETLDKSTSEKRLGSQRGISEMGQRAEALEAELVNIATRFCGPLRAKPELGQLFRELEIDGTRAG